MPGAATRRVGATFVVLLGLCLAVAGCSGGSKASKDIRITSCTRDPGNHRAVIQGEVRNHSSKRSNYAFQVDVRANDSKIETGVGSVLRVAANQRKTFTIHAVGPDVPSGTTLTCKVAHAGRVSS